MKTRHLTAMITLVFAFSMAANAQNEEKTQRTLFLGEIGAHNALGIDYDARFHGNSGLGYHVGVGYSYSKDFGFFIGSYSIRGVDVPLELNYLIGKKKSKLEFGFGTNLGYYNEDVRLYFIIEDGDRSMEYKHKTFGYFLFGDVGYRYQPRRGFTFRAGLTPSFNFGGNHGLDRTWLLPYLGFGYTF